KRFAYIAGILLWAAVQGLLLIVQPHQTGGVIALALLAGWGVSAAHVMPDAIFPDVVEWSELRTRRRNEGVYYGTKNFLRKLAGAVAIFFALQVLGWVGYAAPPEGVPDFAQGEGALLAIRLLMGPASVLLLLGAVLTAWFYPLTRSRHMRVRRILARRKAREEPPSREPNL
ncbi:MAG: MFS transporter, partial [Planctomycetota bacterium]